MNISNIKDNINMRKLFMENVITTKNEIHTKIINTDTISIDIENIEEKAKNIEQTKNIERAKELFDYCRYNDAEQIFLKMKGSEAAAWRMLCYIMTGDIGRKGGKIATLLQESIKNQNADICETVTLLKILVDKHGGSIDRKTKHKAMSSLYDTFNYTIREKMATAINDANKKALEIIKEKGYVPSVFDDKAIPMKVLNNRMMKYKCRIRHYKIDDIIDALKIINSDNFVQDVTNEYLTMAHCNIISTDKFKDRLDTRDQDTLMYVRSLYISNIAHERELRFTRGIDRLQLIDTLNRLNQHGWLRITMMSIENTKYFNMANDEEKTICDIEMERIPTASVATLLEYDSMTEKRGYLIRGNVVNQISKEDVAIVDVTDPYTHEYIHPVRGTVYCDN